MNDLGIFLAGLFVTLLWGSVVGGLIIAALTSSKNR
jgi:hypothetical protein